MPRSNLISSQKSSADKKVKVAGLSNQHCHSSYTTQPYKWIWTKNKNTVLDATASTFTCLWSSPAFDPHASNFLHLRPPASTFIHMHPLFSICIHLHPLLSNCVHLGQPAFTCVHLRPSALTCIHLRISASTFIHLHPLLSTCTHFHPPASTCVHQHPMHPTTSIFAHPRLVIWSMVIWSYQHCLLSIFSNV